MISFSVGLPDRTKMLEDTRTTVLISNKLRKHLTIKLRQCIYISASFAKRIFRVTTI